MQRLAGGDAGFLFIEGPTQTSVCVDLAELSPPGPDAPPLTLAALREHVRLRLELLPAWRWRLESVPLGLHHPVWIEDPDFDLDYHLRQRHLAAPGGPAEVDAMLAEIEPQLLDLRHPLWQIILVHGLAAPDGAGADEPGSHEGERQALIFRFHHTIGDGAALLAMFDRLFGPPALVGDGREGADAPQPVPPRRRAVLARALREQGRNWREAPELFRRTKARFAEVEARRAEAEVTVPRSMGDAPGTRLNRPGPAERTYGRTRLPVADLMALRRATGATMNDVVLAVVAGALRAHLAALGEVPDRPLVANVPVGGPPLDGPQPTWGNRFSNYLCSLATDVDDPLERLGAIAAGTAEAREQLDLQGRDTLPAWLDRLPPAIARPGARFMTRRGMKDPGSANFNVLVSNVRVTDPAWSIGGHGIDHLYMSGPIADDAGLNVTLVGYGDEYHIAVVASPLAVADAAGFVDRLGTALGELRSCID